MLIAYYYIPSLNNKFKINIDSKTKKITIQMSVGWCVYKNHQTELMKLRLSKPTWSWKSNWFKIQHLHLFSSLLKTIYFNQFPREYNEFKLNFKRSWTEEKTPRGRKPRTYFEFRQMIISTRICPPHQKVKVIIINHHK